MEIGCDHTLENLINVLKLSQNNSFGNTASIGQQLNDFAKRGEVTITLTMQQPRWPF